MSKRQQHSFLEGAAILVIATALSKIIGAVFKIPLNNIIGDLGFGYYSDSGPATLKFIDVVKEMFPLSE